MRVFYIAPSILPSRAANAVHVVQQCAALAAAGADVTLLARRAVADERTLPALLKEAYGFTLSGDRLKTFYAPGDRATSLRIAAMALIYFLTASARPDLIVSRNLYASFLLGAVLRRPILFETHQLETGWRKALQRLTMTRPWVKTIVISKKLAQGLRAHHGVDPSRVLVLHDAATMDAPPLAPEEKRERRVTVFPETQGPWRYIAGYFGHLYPGRGIEVIAALAAARPEGLFLVFGGNDVDIARCRLVYQDAVNLRFMGHFPYGQARAAMRLVDIALMPYQERVSIGVAGQDTARWMSPMKMFEYMASGVPIVSSDLPVLREVLRDGENALLVPSADSAAWARALDRLSDDPGFAAKIARTAYEDFLAYYTWARRAQRLMEEKEDA